MLVACFFSRISPQVLLSAYEALEWDPAGNVTVKRFTGEPESNYPYPELISDLVQAGNGAIVECNTAYEGSGASTAMHYQMAEDHGCTAISDPGRIRSMTLPVEGGGKNTVCINVMNRLRLDCDCDGNPAEPDMYAIGTLTSTDPVALEQVCIDLVYASEDGGVFIGRIE